MIAIIVWDCGWFFFNSQFWGKFQGLLGFKIYLMRINNPLALNFAHVIKIEISVCTKVLYTKRSSRVKSKPEKPINNI